MYLDDAALPSAYFDAAKQGQARLRVTATLTSPRPLTRGRWSGNPFAGGARVRRHALGDRFRLRRVAAGSRFAADLAAGLRQADLADDRAALEAWLVERARCEPTGAEERLTLTGPTLGLRLGDRLTLDANDEHEPFAPGPIERIEHRWDEALTRVRYRTGGARCS